MNTLEFFFVFNFELLFFTFISTAKEIVEVIFQSSIEFPFTKVVRIDKASFEMLYGVVIILAVKSLFCKFYARKLILVTNFAFTAFP